MTTKIDDKRLRLHGGRKDGVLRKDILLPVEGRRGADAHAERVIARKKSGEIGEEATGTNIGGIIGTTTNQNINYCINKGKVVGSSQIGGIAGNLSSSYLFNCINSGEIKAEKESVGGIGGIGNNIHYLINCYNSGKVSGNDRTGGIVGEISFIENGFEGKIINCYNTGEIQAKTYAGGIVGLKRGYGIHYIENCYWKEELNLECGNNNNEGNGILEITNSREYKETEMKEESFLQVLNNYVQTYNQGDKAFTKGKELMEWKFSEETGFPIPMEK